jgi:NADH-quinone oxidoreductase subunit J
MNLSPVFILLALVTFMAAAAAMTLRNLVHCALALAVCFVGLAALYLQLDAQFVGFAQVLVYVGAVAILIVFAILLTRSGEVTNESVLAPGWAGGVVVAGCVFALVGWAVLGSGALPLEVAPAPEVTVRDLGDALMTRYIVPLEVIGLLLTAALIGAVVIAMREREDDK